MVVFHRTIATVMLPGQPGKEVDPRAAPPPDVQSATVHLIPSDQPLLAIEHPAILSSIDAGVKSLGGQSAITKVLRSWLLT
jgi:16S rRNA A1518/A1519 N6-dimethyltransferase RsmA/KsgA/DIM1 with predicted DNA glycosylase/AP lyase activity